MRLVQSGYARNMSQLVNRLLADALGVVAKSDAAQEDFSYDMLRKKHLKLSRELIKPREANERLRRRVWGPN